MNTNKITDLHIQIYLERQEIWTISKTTFLERKDFLDWWIFCL